MRRPFRWSLLATALIAALVGTYLFTKTGSLAKPRGEITQASDSSSEPAAQSGSSDNGQAWEVTTSKDPMTDATIRQASATFEGNQFDAEVNVTCNNSGEIAYSATSFGKDHQPAPMRSRTVPFGYSAGVYVDYQMRADDRPAQDLVTANPDYNNQIVLRASDVLPGSGPDPTVETAEEMAAASHVLLQLHMTTGDETFEIPQADAGFRSVVGPCLQERQAKREQLNQQQQQADAQRQSENVAYIDKLYDDPSVDADSLVSQANYRNVPVDQARLAQKRKSEQPREIALP